MRIAEFAALGPWARMLCRRARSRRPRRSPPAAPRVVPVRPRRSERAAPRRDGGGPFCADPSDGRRHCRCLHGNVVAPSPIGSRQCSRWAVPTALTPPGSVQKFALSLTRAGVAFLFPTASEFFGRARDSRCFNRASRSHEAAGNVAWETSPPQMSIGAHKLPHRGKAPAPTFAPSSTSPRRHDP